MHVRDENGSNILHHMCFDTRNEDIVDATMQVVLWLPVEMLDEMPHSGQLAGMTPLHIACGGRDIAGRRAEVIEALCNAGANKEARDKHSRTPLLVCGGAGFRDGAEALHRRGAVMKAALSNGYNFGDYTLKCNTNLKDWWCDITGLQPTFLVKPQSAFIIYRRQSCSDKRHERAGEYWKDIRHGSNAQDYFH